MIDELVKGFDADAFCTFVNGQFSGSFSRSVVSLPLKKEFPWEVASQLGIVKTLVGPNNANMPLLVVAAKLQNGEVLTERSSRIRQFKFAKQVLDDAMSNPAPGVEGLLSQGLFVFHDEQGNFRLSLVYGKAEGAKLVWSTAKRLSFYVEAGQPNKTFRDRLALDWSSFDKLKEAFSVEKLTREFYTRLFAWYQRAMESDEVVFPNDIVKDKEPGEVQSEQIIRLITRLMFVWFLKQKHLVPNDLFDPEKLSEVLQKFDPENGENYYRAILQNLFFATLNTEISDREFAVEGSRAENEEHFGVKIFYRYASEFAVSEKEVIKLFGSIPFMNGGLFECLDRDNHYYDGFSRRKSKRAQVPNALFFDDKGLIPLLSQYNFTVEENSPGDEEVALDPEMLGKVFENLLGAYNPETQIAARNATGSFYTPREIVNYMVDESLIAHLTTQCGEEHTDAIRKLFAEGVRPDDSTLCHALDDALISAKILDPACGSGAFPMGILLRMVELLRILRNIPEDENVYDLKLELIENCIYGGDIQCIAVQISKLRFFISLVCEQKPTDDPKKNYGIDTLPNLETKFVAADSLIGLPKSGDSLPMANVEKLKKDLWEVRHKHFRARSYREKKELRKEDRSLRTALAKELRSGGGFDTASAKLMAEWDPYDQNASAAFSDPEWMYNVKDGFDVVIGNPPYISVEKFSGTCQQSFWKQKYQVFASRGDLYCLFYERGLELLSVAGILSYISSNKFQRAGYGKGLRSLISSCQIHVLIDFCELPVFEAGADPMIVILSKIAAAESKKFPVLVVKDEADFPRLAELVFSQATGYIPKNLSSDGWSLQGGAALLLIEKMRERGTPLSKCSDLEIMAGIKTGLNKAFWIGDAEASRFKATDPRCYADYIKPLLVGDEARRWVCKPMSRYIIYTPRGTNRDRLGPIEGHLALWKDRLEKRALDQEWYELQQAQVRYSETWSVGKIVYPDIALEPRFSIDESGRFPDMTAFSIPSSSKALLGILNSSAVWYFLTRTAAVLGDADKRGRIRCKRQYISKIPIPEMPPRKREQLEILVEKIMEDKQKNPEVDVLALEAEIDELVCELYGLTEEEKAIVEASSAKSDGEKKAKGQKTGVKTAAKKKSRRKKTNLPDSLPGWD